jgi:glycosyltransferase involved in cell wall biosynthesis
METRKIQDLNRDFAMEPWKPGIAPVAVVMISLNEGHHMAAVLENLQGWAQEVFLLDSYSQDDTIEIALRYGVKVYQRRFRGFGDQWNFALENLPITAPWTMKLDPDERLNDQLKQAIVQAIAANAADGLEVRRRLWFMETQLPVTQNLMRVWRTGQCQFSDVLVNEHALVTGRIMQVKGELEHYDSPDLHHWLDKQNNYTTAEAISAYRGDALAVEPRLLGSRLQRQMWLKKHFYSLPGRYTLLFLYYWLIVGTWRAGRVGYIWAQLRADVMRLIAYKHFEIQRISKLPVSRPHGPGRPDNRLPQFD